MRILSKPIKRVVLPLNIALNRCRHLDGARFGLGLCGTCQPDVASTKSPDLYRVVLLFVGRNREDKRAKSRSPCDRHVVQRLRCQCSNVRRHKSERVAVRILWLGTDSSLLVFVQRTNRAARYLSERWSGSWTQFVHALRRRTKFQQRFHFPRIQHAHCADIEVTARATSRALARGPRPSRRRQLFCSR